MLVDNFMIILSSDLCESTAVNVFALQPTYRAYYGAGVKTKSKPKLLSLEFFLEAFFFRQTPKEC